MPGPSVTAPTAVTVADITPETASIEHVPCDWTYFAQRPHGVPERAISCVGVGSVATDGGAFWRCAAVTVADSPRP